MWHCARLGNTKTLPSREMDTRINVRSLKGQKVLIEIAQDTKRLERERTVPLGEEKQQ